MCTEEIKCNKVACTGEGIVGICQQHSYVQFVIMLTRIKQSAESGSPILQIITEVLSAMLLPPLLPKKG